MSHTIALIHNSSVLVDVLKKIFEEEYPEVTTINLIDESLLSDLRTKGGIDYLGVRRICRYALCAEDMGADAALMTCSSLCEAVDVARSMVNIPVFKINEPMIKEAIQTGKRIAIMGTLQSVLAPTIRLAEHIAKETGSDVEFIEALCTVAFEALIAGNPQKHDELLITEVEKLNSNADVIVFAQGTMARLIPKLKDRVSTPILDCLKSGVRQIKNHFHRSD